MIDSQKKKKLKQHKAIATGLFLLMTVIFLLTTWLQQTRSDVWIGYVKAFSEAAMVGALADWFAVTALFNYPLGLKIPHTNLIEKSKDRIGDNLGSFVVTNFLSTENIRPYIEKVKISSFAGKWLSSEKNQELLVNEISGMALRIIHNLDDNSVEDFIYQKAKDISKDIKFRQILGNGIEYLVKNNSHEKIVTELAFQIKKYILENDQIIKERVKKESFALIPSFVDNKIASKITKSLSNFFTEIEQNESHPLRNDITQKLNQLALEIQTDEKWDRELEPIKSALLSEEKIKMYSKDLWLSAKNNLVSELEHEESTLKNYIKKTFKQLTDQLNNDENFSKKIDLWTQKNAYELILRNRQKVADVISTTVGNWEGRELSDKLQLEVGKDLQFIRINGTLVGGLVGLFIHLVQNIIFN